MRRTIANTKFWIAAGVIAAYITLAFAYPVTWQRPVEALIWLVNGTWDILVAKSATPGWIWLLIACVFLVLITSLIACIQRLPSSGPLSSPIRPTKCEMFGVELHWRWDGSTVFGTVPWCSPCQMELPYDRLYGQFAACLRCGQFYNKLPLSHELDAHVVGWLRRQQL